MQSGKYNLLVDAFAGSSGKGKMSTFLAHHYDVNCVVSTNMPNAGHTAIIDDYKFVGKILPTAACLNAPGARKSTGDITQYCDKVSFIGPTAAFTVEQLFKEMEECGIAGRSDLLYIHPRAGIVTEEQKKREASYRDGPTRIGSTQQGSGAFLSDKIMRNSNVKLARDIEELKPYVMEERNFMPAHIKTLMRDGKTFLHEVSQGIALDISNGVEYPYCTSRSTNAPQAINDMGINLKDVGDIYLNVHTTPIRVGHIYDPNDISNKAVLGHSGGFYPDSHEITWTEVGKAAGMPEDVIEKLYEQQKTTVTQRLRRVFTFSWIGLARAVQVSGATKLVLNFAQYLDWNAYQVRNKEALPIKVKMFIKKLEAFTGLPVALVGTGADLLDVVIM